MPSEFKCSRVCAQAIFRHSSSLFSLDGPVVALILQASVLRVICCSFKNMQVGDGDCAKLCRVSSEGCDSSCMGCGNSW